MSCLRPGDIIPCPRSSELSATLRWQEILRAAACDSAEHFMLIR